MHYSTLLCAAVFTSSSLAANSNSNSNSASNSASSSSNSNGGLTLSSSAVQAGSQFDGTTEIGAEAGEAASATSTNNFINFCEGQTLTNGLQILTGSCNGIPMGQIPAKTNMVSSTILNPATGGTIASGETFNITVQMSGIVAGSFTNADSTYFAAPQAVQGGNVVGHTHVTVQDMGGSFNPQNALDPTVFAFFKGINDAGNGQGLLSATVTDGLPAGFYRVCTMASSSNHQPVIMPVAQRGTADDCTKFQVTGNNNTPNAAANSESAGLAAAANAASAVAAGPGNTAPPTTAVAAATTTSAATAATSAAAAGGNTGKTGNTGNTGNTGAAGKAGTGNTGGNTGGFRGGQGKGGRRFAREFIV